MTCIYIMIN